MFFQELSKLLNECDITMSVRGGQNQITVSVVPKSTNKDVKTKLPPLMLSGTPEEVDAGFFNAVNKPVSEAIGFLVSSSAMEKAKKEAEEKLKEKVKESKEKGNKVKAVANEKEEAKVQDEPVKVADPSQVPLF
jgi:PRTRC genetic system protein E